MTGYTTIETDGTMISHVICDVCADGEVEEPVTTTRNDIPCCDGCAEGWDDMEWERINAEAADERVAERQWQTAQVVAATPDDGPPFA